MFPSLLTEMTLESMQRSSTWLHRKADIWSSGKSQNSRLQTYNISPFATAISPSKKSTYVRLYIYNIYIFLQIYTYVYKQNIIITCIFSSL